MAKTLDRIVREEAPDSKVGIKWAVPELKDPTGMLQSTGRSPIGKATFPISQDVPEIIVRRWIRDALALPPEE